MKNYNSLLFISLFIIMVFILAGSGVNSSAQSSSRPGVSYQQEVIAGSAAASTILPVGENFQIVAGKGRENQGKPGVAFDGTNFLTVWCDLNSYSIYAARVSWDGTVLDPEGIPILTNNSQLRQPSVGFDGTNFLVVWEDKRTGSIEEYAARVTSSGQVLDPGGVKLTEGANALGRMPGLAFDGEYFMLVWRTGDTTIRAARISTNGISITNKDAPNGFVVASAGESKYPSVAFDGTNYLAVWQNERGGITNGIDIYGSRITSSGVVLDPDGFVICDEDMNQRYPVVAFDGSIYQVVWYDFRPDGDDIYGSAYGARVTPDGAVLDDNAYLVADRARGQISVQLNCEGEYCLAVWSVENDPPVNFRLTDVYARRLSPDGGVLDQAAIPVATAYGHQFAPVIGYGNGRYLVSWGESVGRDRSGAVYGQLLEEATDTTMSLPANSTAQLSSVLNAAESDASEWVQQLLYNADGYVSGGMAYSADQSFAYGSGVYTYTMGSWEWSYDWDGTYAGFMYHPDDAWVGGWCRSTLHYDGQQWFPPNCWTENDTYDIVTGMWGTGFRNMFASCDSGDILWYDGFWEWYTVNTGVNSDLWDIIGFTQDDIYTAGNWGNIFHYDGDGWQQFNDVPTIQSLNALWGSSTNDIFAVGDFGTILHYDGDTWQLMNSGTLEHLFGVWGASSRDVYAVGFNGTILHYDGVSWQAEASGTTQDLIGVWGVYDEDAGKEVIWTGGRGPVVLEKSIPIVGFEADPEYGTAPLDVKFSNTTSLAFTSSSWDFGDGQTSTAAAPSHRYETTGNYTVTLTLDGPGGPLKLARPEYIKVEEPITGLTATYDGPTLIGERTTFNAWVKTGTNVEYMWDLGLLTAYGPEVSRFYPDTEEWYHNVYVTATNSVSQEAYHLGVWIVEQRTYESFIPIVIR